jgi:flagellar motor switch protein FliM
MADEVLSAAERELLAHGALAATGPHPAAPRRARESHVRPAAAPLSPLDDAIKPHDFQRPRILGDDQMRALASLHERVACGFAPALSTVVRCPAQVRLSQFDQTTYGQWLRELENPTCLSVLRTEPTLGELALDMSLSILFPILDRMMGGGREASPAVRRPLTTIESRQAARVVQQFLSEVAKAWRDVAPLLLSVQRVECDPHAARIVLPGEGVVRARFDVSFAASRGAVSFCLPATVLRKLASNLVAPQRGAFVTAASNQPAQQVTNEVRQAHVELVARLAPIRMPTSELLELRVGDVIVTNHDVQRPLEVTVEGTPKFVVQAGAHQGRKAVRIDAELDTPSEPPSA